MSKVLNRRRSKSCSVSPVRNPIANVETSYVRLKNIELAKTLANLQVKCQTLEKDRDGLFKELVNERSQRLTYSNNIVYVNTICKEAVIHIQDISNLLTQMLEKLNATNVANRIARNESATYVPSASLEKADKSQKQQLVNSLDVVPEDDDNTEDTPDSLKENSPTMTSNRSYPPLSIIREESAMTNTALESVSTNLSSTSVSRTPHKQTTNPNLPVPKNILTENTSINLKVPTNITTRRRIEMGNMSLQSSDNLKVAEKDNSSECDLGDMSTSFHTHFTSTPRHVNHSGSSLQKSNISLSPAPSKSFFVTKRSGSTSKKSSLLPVVILERIDYTPKKQDHQKEQKKPPNKKYEEVMVKVRSPRKRRKATTVTSYAEPTLKKKMRRA